MSNVNCLVSFALSSISFVPSYILFTSCFGKSVTRSNLSKANEKRDSKIFEDYAFYLIDLARKKRSNNDFEIKGKVYAFDSTTIDLCLNIFWWAKFRKAKAGIKMHTLFDITTQIPAFIHFIDLK